MKKRVMVEGLKREVEKERGKRTKNINGRKGETGKENIRNKEKRAGNKRRERGIAERKGGLVEEGENEKTRENMEGEEKK